jgi:hypothetical protein
VRGVDAQRRGDGARVRLRLGDPGARLQIRIEWDGDGRQDPDDGHDDEELDQREATLVAEPAMPESNHGGSSLLKLCSTLLRRPETAGGMPQPWSPRLPQYDGTLDGTGLSASPNPRTEFVITT